MDEVSKRRMLRCAQSQEGHKFDDGDKGRCEKCGLTIQAAT